MFISEETNSSSPDFAGEKGPPPVFDVLYKSIKFQEPGIRAIISVGS
jgi:hypothetical protein